MSDQEMDTTPGNEQDDEPMDAESVPDGEDEGEEEVAAEDEDGYEEASTSTRSKKRKGKGKGKSKGKKPGKPADKLVAELVDPNTQSSDEICDVYGFQNVDFEYTDEDFENISSFKVSYTSSLERYLYLYD